MALTSLGVPWPEQDPPCLEVTLARCGGAVPALPGVEGTPKPFGGGCGPLHPPQAGTPCSGRLPQPAERVSQQAEQFLLPLFLL